MSECLIARKPRRPPTIPKIEPEAPAQTRIVIPQIEIALECGPQHRRRNRERKMSITLAPLNQHLGQGEQARLDQAGIAGRWRERPRGPELGLK
jgi:hypothetical protein